MLMSEERFCVSINEDDTSTLDIIDKQQDKCYNFVNDVVSLNQAKQVVDLLNSLNETVRRKDITIQILTENIEKLSDDSEMLKVLHKEQEKNEQLRQTTNEQKEAIDYLKTVIRYTIPNQMVADVFKRIGEEYE